MLSQEKCAYFLVSNPPEHSVIPYSILITLLSTIVNFIGCYVIIRKSKKETNLFRFTLFGNLFTLWLSQGYWAISMNTMPLFPFPALYSSNFLNNLVSTYTAFRVWLILLSFFVLFLIGQLIVRHRMVVRPESFFNFPSWFYIGFLTIGWLTLLPFLLTVWKYCDSTDLEKVQYIEENFPGCEAVTDLQGVLIITNVHALYILLGLMVVTGVGALGVYFISSGLMLFELSKQTRKMSKTNFNHQRKIVVDTTIQIVIKSIFISTWPFWIVISYFVSPQMDTRIISTLINSLFVCAPIPGTISMLILNSSYRRFVTENILRRKTSAVIPSRYALPLPADSKYQFH
ncbi:Protein CBG27365 [Caenorhabditis briggsae]|uniref:Protein CBG27365 n=1 Tax=Caenorhabditis briggsae TaxID=6238 RepID=B6IGG5_CAEBR|nr:Protein CBG27365 [Caenorhabditis briggsae]CAR98995.1 Protein CBG27365 [Caenorhabditis briggsae]